MNQTASPDKILKLERSENPDTLTAIHTREKVCEDLSLSDGAARMFTRLLDFALNPYVNNGRKGEIIISQMKLSELLGCGVHAVRRRTAELINYVWISRIPRPNSKPIICYHITAFQAPREVRQEMTGDGLWGNCKRRYDHGGFPTTGNSATNKLPKNGTASKKGPMGGGLVDRFGNQLSSFLAENDVGAVENDRSHRQIESAASGRDLPVGADLQVRSDRQIESAGSGRDLPVPADSIYPSEGTPRTQIGESQQEPESCLEPYFKRSTVNAVDRGRNSAENRFLEEVSETFERWKPGNGEYELKNSGGFWRMGFRSAPGLMRRVLADTLCAIKEGRISYSPGQHASDLWVRWGGREALDRYYQEMEKLNPVKI